MQKWEYLFLAHYYSDGQWPNTIYKTSVNDDPKTERTQTVAEFYDFCNQLGSDGWELVGIATEGHVTQATFKRPKE